MSRLRSSDLGTPVSFAEPAEEEEETCPCPVCERGPGPFDLPCEFSGRTIFGKRKWNDREHFIGMGPRFAESKWEQEYPHRTWEIRWPEQRLSQWPEELLGVMEFEIEWYVDHCDISLEG